VPYTWNEQTQQYDYTPDTTGLWNVSQGSLGALPGVPGGGFGHEAYPASYLAGYVPPYGGFPAASDYYRQAGGTMAGAAPATTYNPGGRTTTAVSPYTGGAAATPATTPTTPSAPLNPAAFAAGAGGQTAQPGLGINSTPAELVYNAFRDAGIDPTKSPNLYVRQVLQHADDLIANVVGRAVQSGQTGIFDPARAADLMSTIRGLVQQGAAGGAIFAGAGEAPGLLGAARSFVQNVPTAGTVEGPGASLLRAMLTDPERATNLISSLMYGLAEPGASRLLQGQLAKQAAYEIPRAMRAGQPGPQAGALDYLLRAIGY